MQFSLSPHAVDFHRPIILEIDAASTTAQEGAAVILWHVDDRSIPVPTVWRGTRATAELDHFSDFGLGICVPVEDPDTEDGCRPVEPSTCLEEEPTCLGVWANGWTGEMCLADGELWFRDADRDGIDNLCEEDLAYFFRPLLRTSFDCSWDEGLNRLGGEYLYFVQRPAGIAPRGAPLIQIIYLPAYYADCGSPFVNTQHSGDSEFVNVEVQFYPETNRWETRKVFTSAHCGTLTADGRCQWWAATQITEWADGRGLGAPTILVSRDKHANYRSRQACEGGIAPVDTCPPNGPNYRFPVPWGGFNGRNIGSRGFRLIDETVALSGSAEVSPTRVETIWASPNDVQWDDPQFCGPAKVFCRFNGWQGTAWGDAPKPYGMHFREWFVF